MGIGLKFYEACEYITPKPFVARETAYIDRYDPLLVDYEPGSIGFEFIKIVAMEMKPGKVILQKLHRNQFYYWGQKLLIEELYNFPQYANYLQTGARVFCMNKDKAIFPIDDDAEVVPYPESANITELS